MSLGGFVSCGAKFLRYFQLNICCNLRMVFHMKMYFLAALEVIACNRRTSKKNGITSPVFETKGVVSWWWWSYREMSRAE